MRSGEMSPTAPFAAVAGKEYFLESDYVPVASAPSLGDLRASPSVQGADDLHIVADVSK
jgi:hypothetical protein